MVLFYLHYLKKYLNIAKKIFLVFIVYFIVISLFSYFINKNKPRITYDLMQRNREEIYKIINDKNLNSTKEGRITIALYRVMLCVMIGEGCTNSPDDGDKNFNKSLFGFVSNLIVLPYVNPPASGVYWTYDGLQNAGLIPKTYAAEGIGFAALKPFINIWKIFRDLAYMILVLVLIALGFMIMFRMKLNPQTVISVENALPKIVISLLLITFSFAIAGFLIDLMYVIILIAVSILSSTNIGKLQPGNQAQLFNDYTNNGFAHLWPPSVSFFNLSIGSGLINILGDTLKTTLHIGIGVLITYFTSGVLVKLPPFSFLHKTLGLENVSGEALSFGANVGKFFSGIVEFLVFVLIFTLLSRVILPVIITILVCITVVLLIFRVLFILLAAYLRIVFYIIISPIILLLEAIPGKNIFSTWFNNLFVDIMTFPLVIIILLLGHAVMEQSLGKNVWVPPFLYSIDPSIFTVLIGLGLTLIIPDLIKAFKESFGAKGLGVDIGIGTFFTGVGAAVGGTRTGIGLFTSLSQMPFIGSKIASHPFYEKVFGPSPSKTTGSAVAEQMEKILSEKYGLTPKQTP